MTQHFRHAFYLHKGRHVIVADPAQIQRVAAALRRETRKGKPYTITSESTDEPRTVQGLDIGPLPPTPTEDAVIIAALMGKSAQMCG